MPICDEALVKEILGIGYELPGVECKAAAPITNDWVLRHVLRAMVGMSNLQDGGIVLIGVGESGNTLVPQGLNHTDLQTWTYDDLASKAAPYFDPALRFHTRIVSTGGRDYFAVEVEEFEIHPTLIKKQLQAIDPQTNKNKVILREGACYVRSRAKRETREVPTAEDMRALLELAIQKGVNQWVQNARIAGLIPSATTAKANPIASKYDDELGAL
jgi:predicted HTH transcriptional regulator